MRSKIFTFCVLFTLLCHASSAQDLGIKIGLNVGASRLYHNTLFENTKLHALYEFVKLSHPPNRYSWEQFEQTYQIRSSYVQPRFGMSAHLTYRDWPIFAIVDATSSASSYEKLAVAATLGLGKEFPIGDNIGMYLNLLGGYKFVRDRGFGSTTITNSIGLKEAREQAATFFNPTKPLGTQDGNLFTMRLGLSKALDEAENLFAGAELYGELDMTDKTAREGGARMHNAGVNVFLRFRIMGGKREEGNTVGYPNPAGGRRN